MNKECSLKNDKGKTIAMGSKDQMFRFVQHHCPDGIYAVEGPGVDLTLERMGGVVFPSSGTVDEVRLLPRNKEECKDFFLGESDQNGSDGAQ